MAFLLPLLWPVRYASAARQRRAGTTKTAAARSGSTGNAKRSAGGKRNSASQSGPAALPVSSAAPAVSDVPVGMVFIWSSSRLPSGYLWCDGGEIPKEPRFNALRAAIGDRTPDMRGAFVEKQPASTLNYVIKFE